MCVSDKLHHPDTHHWLLTRHILLAVTILYSCLSTVAGLSSRCSYVPGRQCSVPRIRFFANAEECNPRVTWDCADVGFATERECETACGVNPEDFDPTTVLPTTSSTRNPAPSSLAIPDLCFLPPSNPLCIPWNRFTRFYYNPEARQCLMFDFFGCQSNANNFETREDCETTCSGNPRLLSTSSTLVSSMESLVATPSLTSPSPSLSLSYSPSHLMSYTAVSVATSTVIQITPTNVPPPPPPSSSSSSPTHVPIASTVSIPISTTSDTTSRARSTPTMVSSTTPPTDTQPTDTLIPPIMNNSVPSTSPTSEPALSLSAFDYASVGVGVLALCLILLLVAIMSVIMHRYWTRIKQTKSMKQNNTPAIPAYAHKTANSGARHVKQTYCQDLYTTV